MGPNQYVVCPFKKGKFGDRGRHAREKKMWRDTGRGQVEVADGVMYVQGNECQKLPASDQKLRERHGLDPPMQPLKELPLLTLGSWVTSLQNWGRDPCRFTGSSLVFKGSVLGPSLCLYSSLLKDLLQSCALSNIYRPPTNSSDTSSSPHIQIHITYCLFDTLAYSSN